MSCEVGFLADAPTLIPLHRCQEYNQNDPVEMKVNKLTSAKTQLPYGYYHLAFCTMGPQ